AATRPLCRDTDRFDTIVQAMITPRPGFAPTPSLASPFVLCNGCLRVGGTGKPAGFNTLDMFCNSRGLFGLGRGVGHGRLLGQLAGVDEEKTEGFDSQSPVSIFHFHPAGDTAAVPASRGLLTCPARFFE